MAEKERVFVVDDDVAIRNLLKDFLKVEGYKVADEAGSLKDALEKIKEVSQKGVTVAFVDGSLVPQVDSTKDGERIASELRKEVPGIKIIALSGQKANFGDVNLQKPVSVGELARALEN